MSGKNNKIQEKTESKQRQVPLTLGVVRFLLTPVMSGIISSWIMALGLLDKLQLHKFGLNNMPTITMDGVISTNYRGLRISVVVGFITGLIILNIFKLAAKWTPLFRSDPSESADSITIPSAMNLVKPLIQLAALPLLVFMCSSIILKLAEMDLLPFVAVDKSFRIFEMTSTGVVMVAALGCLLVFICDTVMSYFLKDVRRKNTKRKK